MKIAAITKFKQGELFQLLRKLNWTQIEFARRCGYINSATIGRVINLTSRPSEDMMNRMQRAFAEAGEYVDVLAMFPEYYIGFKQSPTVFQVREIARTQLENFAQHQQLLLEEAQPPIPSDAISSHEALEAFGSILTEQERQMLVYRFVDGKGRVETGQLMNPQVSGTCIKNREDRALHKLRNHLEKLDELGPGWFKT